MQQQRVDLTAQVKEYLPRYFSTEPADFDTWERAARKFYALTHRDWPSLVIRTQSPEEALAAFGEFERKEPRNEHWEDASFYKGFPFQSWLNRSPVYSGLLPPFIRQDTSDIVLHLGNPVVQEMIRVRLCQMYTGRPLGALAPIVETLETAVSSVGCWIPGEKVVVVSDRPQHMSCYFGQRKTHILRKEEMEMERPSFFLHSEGEPLLVWRNGQSTYHHKGFAMVESNIEGENPGMYLLDVTGWDHFLEGREQEVLVHEEDFWLIFPGKAPDYKQDMFYVFKGKEWSPTWYKDGTEGVARIFSGSTPKMSVRDGQLFLRKHFVRSWLPITLWQDVLEKWEPVC